MATFEKATVGEKISNYVENRQNVLIAILAVVVAAVIAYTVAVTVASKANTKGLAAIDTISYVMTQESASLSEEELEMRRNKALEDLSAYLEKGGIVGVRANMLAGEIYYSVKDFKNSAKCWTSAAAKEKNYDCSGSSSQNSYSLSIDEGKIDDDDSGSTFYWNLIDENFLREYYDVYFEKLSDDVYEETAAETVEYIYLYAETLKTFDTTNTTVTACNGTSFW